MLATQDLRKKSRAEAAQKGKEGQPIQPRKPVTSQDAPLPVKSAGGIFTPAGGKKFFEMSLKPSAAENIAAEITRHLLKNPDADPDKLAGEVLALVKSTAAKVKAAAVDTAAK